MPDQNQSCAKTGQCPKNRICHPVDKRCYRRNDSRIKDVVEVTQSLADNSKTALWYPPKWKKRPGQRGFNEYVRELIKKKLKLRVSCDFKKPEPQSFQRLLQWIASPDTQMHRLLVQWQLGAGKTIGMITVLNNFYNDNRPKIVVFPNRELVRNFYGALAHWPNRYKQWYERTTKKKYPSSGSAEAKLHWIEGFERACADLKSSLPSPMRAFTYSIAGGKTLEKDRIMFSTGRGASRGRPSFDNVVMMCDEAHNMVKPGDKFTTVQQKLMRNTGKKIMQAKQAVVCLFTATPIVDTVQNFVDLMRIVTGDPQLPLAVQKEEIEVGGEQHTVERLRLPPREERGLRQSSQGVLDGYISCFMQRPKEAFAETSPNAEDERPEVIECPLQGRLLEKYVASRYFRSGKLPKAPKTAETRLVGKLWNLETRRWVADNAKNRANDSCVDEKPVETRPTKAAALQCLVASELFEAKECKTTLQRYENTLSGGRNAGPSTTTGNMADTAAKLATIVGDLEKSSLKTVILMHKSTGYELLIRLLQAVKGEGAVLYVNREKSGPMTKRQAKAAELEIEKFNANNNMRGERHQILVLPSEEYSRGCQLVWGASNHPPRHIDR